MSDFVFAAAILGMAAVSLYSAYTFQTTIQCIRESNQALLKEVSDQYRADKRDLLDRLMARDVAQLKQAQAIERETPGKTATSKSSNEARLSEEQRRELGK